MCGLDWVKPGWFRAKGIVHGGVGRKSKRNDALWCSGQENLISSKRKKRRGKQGRRKNLPFLDPRWKRGVEWRCKE